MQRSVRYYNIKLYNFPKKKVCAVIRWSLLAEFFSLFILGIIFVRYYCYERKVAFTRKRRLFLFCLLSSGASILLNILCVFTLARPDAVPLWVNMALNTVYFLLSAAMCSLFAYFLLILILEHVYSSRCLRSARRVLMALTAAFAALSLATPFTGLLFYFDENGYYQRGPLNQIGYGFLFLELLVLAICFFRNRSSVSTHMVYVMRSLLPFILALSLFQLCYPEILLNGTLSAAAILILFIAFQSHTNDHDSLTGVRSHNNFLTELSLRIAGRQSIQVIMVSLLSLSDINLQHGHAVGDAVLYEAAQYLERLSPQGRAFRPGNTTFALVLPWTSQQQADRDLEAVRCRFQEPWVLGDLVCRSDFCMTDLCCGDQPGSSAEQVLEQLEYALSLAKADRGIVRFDEQVARSLRHKQGLIGTLRRSIQERRFRVWYQPIYNCREHRFCSAEALLRLMDQEGTIIPPDTIVPLAEETGMIGDLTWLVLDEVCRLLSGGTVPQLKAVTVNLSMQQLLDEDLSHRLLSILDAYALTPDRVKLEITERFLLHDARHARRQLAALKSAGFEIYMDDFGVGYSNLSSVLDYPLDCIKLDRSLIRRLPGDQRSRLMAETLLTLFHRLDKTLIVEGVETAEQAEYLAEQNADMIQGFYYACPMPQEALAEFFRDQDAASEM